jgi:acid phosphatase (class A)
MARSLRDVGATVLPFKELYKRPRPPLADAAVTVCVRLPENGLNSYPSGHAMWGAMAGTLLAELVPAKADALKARGLDYGLSRAVCGVHYPSDVAAGQALSAALLAQLQKDPAFKADYEATKAELAALLQP